MITKFSKQGIQPDPREVDYWVDMSTDPYGSVIKYFNGDSWVNLIANGEIGMSPFDYFTKEQINRMLNNKADVGSVDSKVDDKEIEHLIESIEVKDVGNSAVQLIVTRHNNTKVGTTIPVASGTTPGIVTASDFANFVKQHLLQSLYSEMYDLLADIRAKYQPRLKAGKNILIDRATNTISATGQLSVDWDKIVNAPEIPNKTSQLINDSNFVTSSDLNNTKTELNKNINQVSAKVTANLAAIESVQQSIPAQISEAIGLVIAGADSSFDTLKEIADYIASDKTGAAEMSTAIASNKTAIEKEVSRATSVENSIFQRIEDIESGTSVDYVTEQVLNDAVAQLSSSDADLLTAINKEISDRKSAVSTVETIANAAATKVALQTEVERATGVENLLQNKINSLESTTDTLTTNLSAEVSRATSVEQTLRNDISTLSENVDIEISDISTIAEEAKALSIIAVDTSYEFAQTAESAKTIAEAAKNAISTLQGLTDVDTSALTTAEIVAQVEQNAANILFLLNRDVVLTESSFSLLPSKDVTKHYLIYDDPE